jgi:hypothetical protein
VGRSFDLPSLWEELTELELGERGVSYFDVIALGREWLDGVSPHLVKSVCLDAVF